MVRKMEFYQILFRACGYKNLSNGNINPKILFQNIDVVNVNKKIPLQTMVSSKEKNKYHQNGRITTH